nr:hypothetical protein [Thiocystis violacea]
MKRRLRIRAAEHGRSMEEEAREILRLVVGEPAPPVNIAAAIRARVTGFEGADLLVGGIDQRMDALREHRRAAGVQRRDALGEGDHAVGAFRW